MKNKLELKHWGKVRDTMATSEKYPSITLTHDCARCGMTCTVYPDGNIQLATVGGGGHGMGNWEDDGRSVNAWIALLEEAEEVGNYYFGDM